MFTVEMDEDETLITVVDDSASYEDVAVHLFDDFIYIRQWNETIQDYNEVAMSPDMYVQIMEAWTSESGAYAYTVR